MNYLFYTQCLTPEQASRLLCNLGIYKVEHLKTVPVTYKSYLIKRSTRTHIQTTRRSSRTSTSHSSPRP